MIVSIPSRAVTLLAAGLFVSALAAQTHETTTNVSGSDSDRSFVLVEGSSIRSFTGSWHSSSPLLRYAHDHRGNYIVFEQGTEMHRLDKPERLAEVQRLYAPMQELATKQQAYAHAQQSLAQEQQKLASAQRPLAQSQHNIAGQQRSTQDPQSQGQMGHAQGVLGEEQGELGSAQGDLGRQQGDIGAVQGALGHKQGEIARAANKRLQVMFNECLADGSCPRVAS